MYRQHLRAEWAAMNHLVIEQYASAIVLTPCVLACGGHFKFIYIEVN